MEILSFISLITYILVASLKVSVAVDSIVLSQSLKDGMTIVSQDGTFELGFLNPGSSNKRYLGIWYKNIPIRKVVWVANRENPINGSFGIIVLNSTGSLVLSQNNTVLWYTTLKKQAQKPVAKLLDYGNLVVRDEEDANPEAYLWQSFDYPSDTMLPGMKLGWDLKIGLKWHLTAWRSPEDPSPGDFSWGIELDNYPQAVTWKGNEKFFRDGPWNGMRFSGGRHLKSNPLFSFNFVFDNYEAYYIFSLKNNSEISIIVMNQTDHIRYRYVWVETYQNWMVYSSFPRDFCDHYGLCGVYGNCIMSDSPMCQCLKGFKPTSLEKWNSMDWSQGCVRNKPLNCTIKQKDGFFKMSGLKLPDTTHTWLDQTIGLEECRVKCLNNCSCMAYTNSDIRGEGSGCALWFGDLIDIRQFQVDGQDLYIRMDASEIEAEQGHKKLLTKIIITIIAIVISGMLLLGCYYILKVCKNNNGKKSENVGDQIDAESEDGIDFPLVDFSTLAMATNNFSTKNKIGEGGFGPVYKGRLEHGQEVAVKRLSKSSGQGKNEFKNEVKLIAKVQHRNLVKLLGFCIHGQDKLLVYEYMPNGSLDSYIFDVIQGKVLDWSKRFLIICGIARGLMYLHKDSRLRIIHRDLKASNVLLDDMLNPKISDFGMARIIGGDQTEGKTNRVVGTYGYMAPEYASDGLFSVKSDVFSFGILLLEIIYGKRNRGFYHADLTLNLIGHAWILWKEGRTSELIDQNIKESCIFSEVLRCIHIGLLCVQQHPEDRPTMSSVVLMLESEIDLSKPKEPGFFPRRGLAEENSSSRQLQPASTNEMTVTVLEAR